jgi:hypothetical protein
MKSSKNPSRIEPATFRFAGQCLKQKHAYPRRRRITKNWYNSASFIRRDRKIAKSDYQFRDLCPPVCTSIRLSVHMKQLASYSTDFYEIWYLWIFFFKSAEKIQVSRKSDKNNGYLTWTPMYAHLYIAAFFSEWEMFPSNCRESRSTHLTFSIFFPKLSHLRGNIGKHVTAWLATFHNIIRRTKGSTCVPHN